MITTKSMIQHYLWWLKVKIFQMKQCLFDASIDFSRLVAKGEDLQSVEVEGSIVDATIKPLTMVVEGQVTRSHQLTWLT